MSDKPQVFVTSEQVAQLKVELQRMEKQLPEIEKAEKAGFDVAVSKQKLLDAIARIKKIISVYG